jgi:ABC-type branched-subunit amino acid transport system substrate-binding protein
MGLFGCAGAPPPPAPHLPTIGVAVPLSGPNAAAGAAAVAGVELAAGAGFVVQPVDDALPDAAARLAAEPDVVAVVAHVTRAPAESQADAWRATDLPVIVAAPGAFTGLPRVVPPVAESAKCAAAFLDVDFWARTDGTQVGMAAAKTLLDTAPGFALGMDTVNPTQTATAAGKLVGRQARAVVWTGDAAAGGNFLRALRQVGFDQPFIGVGLYETRFLDAAGADAEGARVTSEGRPARSQAFLDAWQAKTGTGPSAPAVDAYEAGALLVAAWRAAASGTTPVTREALRAALSTVVAEGASGPMHLGPDGVLQPVLCAVFTVRGGTFVVDRIASEDEPLPVPAPPPRGRRRRRY